MQRGNSRNTSENPNDQSRRQVDQQRERDRRIRGEQDDNFTGNDFRRLGQGGEGTFGGVPSWRNFQLQHQNLYQTQAPLVRGHDTGDATGVWGEETDELMQQVLERSFLHHQQTNEEEAMLRQALENSKLSYEASLPIESTFDDDLISIQLASLFENHDDEIAALTINEFDRLKSEYIASKGRTPKPTVEMALEIVNNRRNAEDRRATEIAAAEVEFDDVKHTLSDEEYTSARKIFFDLLGKTHEDGGRMPSVDMAISMARDKIKERELEEARLRKEAEEKAEAEEQARVEQARRQREGESADERRRRFAEAFDKKFQQKE